MIGVENPGNWLPVQVQMQSFKLGIKTGLEPHPPVGGRVAPFVGFVGHMTGLTGCIRQALRSAVRLLYPATAHPG